MVTKILHKSLLRNWILTAASLAFSLEAMAVDDVTRDGVKYSLDEANQEATVTGFDAELLPPELSKDTIQEGGVTYKVTSIGDDAFLDCSSLTSVSFPNVISIGKFAFYDCIRLTSVSFPNVTSIEDYAFERCSNLRSVSFPNVISIGKFAFDDCHSLTSVDFPNMTSIGANAFVECHSLTSVSFPNVTSIGANAFYYCSNLTSVSFPNVTSIGEYAFYDCYYNLTSVDFPKVISIGDGAFQGCSNLTSVSFPNVTSIGEYAFYYCSNLTSVSFPNVISIGDGAFNNCAIKTITLNQPDLLMVNAEVYANFGTLSNITLYVPAEALQSYKEDKNWSNLGFKDIQPINWFIADGIVYTKIDENTVEVTAGNCYEGELELPSTVTDKAGKQYSVVSIGEHAFYKCAKLTGIEIPNTVTYIGKEAFYNTGLTSVVVPASVTGMGAEPFHFCQSLKTAEILAPIDTLNCTFSECENLQSVILPGSLKCFGSYAFFNCKSLDSIVMKQYKPSSIKVSTENPFGTNKGYEMLDGTVLYVPNGTKGDYESSSLYGLFKNIQEYTPTYKAKIYNGRDYEQGYVSMNDKLSDNNIAVVEELIYDLDFDITQSENIVWMTEANLYKANTIRLVDSLPAYFPVGFLANEISYTRTPSIYNEKAEGATGWETLYLPFAATTVTADGDTITPFNYGGMEKKEENISAGNDFWAKEPVMDVENTLYFSHISDAKFEAGMPYLISFPGEGFGKYSLNDKAIVFSGSNVNVSATDDLSAGVNCGQYTMAGTSMGLSSSEAEDYYLFMVEYNEFQKKVGEGVVPFRCYVQKTPSEEGSSSSSSSSSSLKSSRGNVVFVGSYEDYMAQQDDNTTLQSNANADQVIIYAQDNNIILVASEPGVATVCNLNGQIIKCVNYQEGLNNLGDFAQGVYLINGVKVIVK